MQPSSKRQKKTVPDDERFEIMCSSALSISAIIGLDTGYIVSEFLGHLPGNQYFRHRNSCFVCGVNVALIVHEGH